ncbi:MAG TPA: xylulokinase [Gaiellales bacterium]|nr:xylulokinase [Gaiellales bacterium]
MTALVGLDIGTSSTKAIAIAPDGAILARAQGEYPVSTPRPGHSEQDPELWWRAAEAALAGLGRDDVAGIGLSGQMHGLVLLDDRMRPLRPAILWSDQRTGVECAEIERTVGFERLIELTGNRALTGFTAPKLLWVRRHEPDVYRRIAHVLLPKDYVRHRLTGELATDVSDASGTLLFDVGRRRWSEEMLELLDLPREWFPPALESAAASGATAAGAPVAAGGGDQAAGAIGVGVDRPGSASVAVGTSGVVFGVLPALAADPRGTAHTFCHAVPGTWHAMGVMLSAGGALDWFQRSLAAGAAMDDLLAAAAAWPPGCEGLWFAPYLAGERTPHADPDARGAFVGLTLRHDRGALTRAVLEGVAYGLRDSLELLHGLGLRPSAGRVGGGGSRSELWLRIIASTLDLPLEITATDDAAALGAAMLGGVAAGVFPDVAAAVASCVGVTGTIEPDADWRAAYAEGYATFGRLYPALRGAMGE